jgi:hypothetical protein
MWGFRKKAPGFSRGPNGRCAYRHLRRHVSRHVWDSSFSSMNGWEQVSMKLAAGDQVRFRYEGRAQSGLLWMEWIAPDGTVVFRRSDEPSEVHTLTANLAGRYCARVTADHASGGFRLEILPGQA